MATNAKPPSGLGARGKRLWRSIHDAHPEITATEREVAVEACRVVDRLDHLDALCRAEPAVVEGKFGPMANPAYAEARQQANLLKQLVTALRIPDAATGRRGPRIGNRTPALTGPGGATVTGIRQRLRTAGSQ